MTVVTMDGVTFKNELEEFWAESVMSSVKIG